MKSVASKLKPISLLSLLVLTAFLSTPANTSVYAQSTSGNQAGATPGAAQSPPNSPAVAPAVYPTSQSQSQGGEKQSGVLGQGTTSSETVPRSSSASPAPATAPIITTSDTSPQVLAPNAPEGAIASSPERKLFYSSGHWWAFWEDNLSPSNFVYSSSSDEVTWSSPTVIAAGLSYGCECTSVWVSGGTVYYAIANGSNYFDYNSGTLNAAAQSLGRDRLRLPPSTTPKVRYQSSRTPLATHGSQRTRKAGPPAQAPSIPKSTKTPEASGAPRLTRRFSAATWVQSIKMVGSRSSRLPIPAQEFRASVSCTLSSTAPVATREQACNTPRVLPWDT